MTTRPEQVLHAAGHSLGHCVGLDRPHAAGFHWAGDAAATIETWRGAGRMRHIEPAELDGLIAGGKVVLSTCAPCRIPGEPLPGAVVRLDMRSGPSTATQMPPTARQWCSTARSGSGLAAQRRSPGAKGGAAAVADSGRHLAWHGERRARRRIEPTDRAPPTDLVGTPARATAPCAHRPRGWGPQADLARQAERAMTVRIVMPARSGRAACPISEAPMRAIFDRRLRYLFSPRPERIRQSA
jgi:hypothetical protein